MTFNKTNGLCVALVTVAFASAGCSGIKKSLEASQAASPTAGTIGVRHMDQLALSMAAVTGVSMTAPAVNSNGGNLEISSFNDYNGRIRPWLSTDGNATSVTAPMLLSSTSLAGMFCSTMIRQESQSLNRLQGTGIQFNRGVSGLTPDVVNAVNSKFASMFWRRELSAEESQILSESVSEALKGTSDVQVALLVPCSVALSSVAFLSI